MTAPAIQSQGGLADLLNVLLDKGLVIDASVRVSLIGIEILAIEIKVVIASVDTYIRYLEAMHRLDAARRGLVAPPPVSQGIGGTYGLLASAVPAVPPAPAMMTPATVTPATAAPVAPAPAPAPTPAPAPKSKP